MSGAFGQPTDGSRPPILEGVVATGRGRATAELERSRDEIAACTGARLHPGSLDVVLTGPVRFDTTRARAFDGGARFLWPAAIEGLDEPAWLYRWGGCPLHVVEVLSPVHLRKALALEDGDTVRLRLEPGTTTGIAWVRRVAWVALWAGRRGWYYDHETYKRLVYLPHLHELAAQW